MLRLFTIFKRHFRFFSPPVAQHSDHRAKNNIAYTRLDKILQLSNVIILIISLNSFQPLEGAQVQRYICNSGQSVKTIFKKNHIKSTAHIFLTAHSSFNQDS